MIPVVCTYRARPGSDTALRDLIEDHWPSLYRMGLVTSTPALLLRDSHNPCRFVEYFEWFNDEALEKAHKDPEVQKIWGRMRELTEMGGIEPSHFRCVGKRPNLVQAVLPVTDIDLAVKFYTDVLGLTGLHRQGPDEIILSTRGSGVALRAVATATSGAGARPRGHVVFWRDSVSARRAELEARGVVFAGDVVDRGRGLFYTEFCDPDGNIIGIQGGP